jgi:hypothetical protein
VRRAITFGARRIGAGVLDDTEAGPQCVLPGAEKATDSTLAKRRAALPLKPLKPQEACDQGLFSDDADQREFFK